jgi:hypothetical protein
LRPSHKSDQPLRIHLVGISENGSESIESSTLVDRFSPQKFSTVGLTYENQFSHNCVRVVLRAIQNPENQKHTKKTQGAANIAQMLMITIGRVIMAATFLMNLFVAREMFRFLTLPIQRRIGDSLKSCCDHGTMARRKSKSIRVNSVNLCELTSRPVLRDVYRSLFATEEIFAQLYDSNRSRSTSGVIRLTDQRPLKCDRNNDFDSCRKTLTQRSCPHHSMLLYLKQFLSWRVFSMQAQYGSLVFRPLTDHSTAIIPVHPTFLRSKSPFSEGIFIPLIISYLLLKKRRRTYCKTLSSALIFLHKY